MKTKGRAKSKNIEDRRFEKVQPKGKVPYSTLRAKREKRIEATKRYRRGVRNETVYNLKDKTWDTTVTAKRRGKKVTVKTKSL